MSAASESPGPPKYGERGQSYSDVLNDLVRDAEGSSDVRLNTERIDAAARAICEMPDDGIHLWEDSPETDREWHREAARRALDAADVAGSWNDTERLRTALSDAAEMLAIASRFALNVGEDISSRSFAASADDARAALAESVPSPPAKAKK